HALLLSDPCKRKRKRKQHTQKQQTERIEEKCQPKPKIQIRSKEILRKRALRGLHRERFPRAECSAATNISTSSPCGGSMEWRAFNRQCSISLSRHSSQTLKSSYWTGSGRRLRRDGSLTAWAVFRTSFSPGWQRTKQTC